MKNSPHSQFAGIDIKDAIHLNQQIINFFAGAMCDYGLTHMKSKCPDGITFEDHVLNMVSNLVNPINLGTFLHRLTQLQKRKSIRGLNGLYTKIWSKILQNKMNVFEQNWNAQNIGNSLYGLQNSSNVPLELFSAFAQVIPKVTNWDAQNIGNALYGLSHLDSNSENVDSLIALLISKIGDIDIGRQSFLHIQALVIGLHHVGYEIPPNLQARWDCLVETEGRQYSSITKHEKTIRAQVANILVGYRDDQYEIVTGAYVHGYEVDMVILDAVGKVICIIESDGDLHNTLTKQRRDVKRDRYFLDAGVTDLIIRVTTKGKITQLTRQNPPPSL